MGTENKKYLTTVNELLHNNNNANSEMKNLAEEIMSKNDELEKIKSELDKIKEKMGEKDEELNNIKKLMIFL